MHLSALLPGIIHGQCPEDFLPGTVDSTIMAAFSIFGSISRHGKNIQMRLLQKSEELRNRFEILAEAGLLPVAVREVSRRNPGIR